MSSPSVSDANALLWCEFGGRGDQRTILAAQRLCNCLEDFETLLAGQGFLKDLLGEFTHAGRTHDGHVLFMPRNEEARAAFECWRVEMTANGWKVTANIQERQ